jgi:hypothetical protein
MASILHWEGLRATLVSGFAGQQSRSLSIWWLKCGNASEALAAAPRPSIREAQDFTTSVQSRGRLRISGRIPVGPLRTQKPGIPRMNRLDFAPCRRSRSPHRRQSPSDIPAEIRPTVDVERSEGDHASSGRRTRASTPEHVAQDRGRCRTVEHRLTPTPRSQGETRHRLSQSSRRCRDIGRLDQRHPLRIGR